MRRASAARLALVAALAVGTPARADDDARVPASEAPAAAAPGDLHAQLVAQFAAEAQTVATASTTVSGKLAAVDALRTRRARSAARVLATPPAATASPADRLAAARRAAAARLLLARDLDERGLLAEELGRLTAAGARIAADAGHVDGVVAPHDLTWPARGTVARAFGPYVHDRSKATLSRRGVDLEVEDHAQVASPTAGVVRYAGPIRGLEQGLVIDAGAYLVVLAKLAEPALVVGAEVHAGDRVGHAARHRVYLEVRLPIGAGGTPIDPIATLGPKPGRR